jgi:hypothetical protein
MGIPLRMSRWTLFLTFIQSPAVKEHETIKRYIIKVSSHHLVIVKIRSKFVLAALELILQLFVIAESEMRNYWKLPLFGEHAAPW